MFFKILQNYLLGYVSITIEGYFVERLINICKAEKILLWNIKRKNGSTLAACIGMKDFKRIKPMVKKTKCRVRINKKKGTPFFLHRYQKRKIFVFFLLFIAALLVLTSNFVWHIEVQGNQTISSQELIQELNKNGLSVGMFKGKIDSKKIMNQIRLQRNDLAWMGIELKGTNAIVKVVEADKKPEMINESEYCNVVADKEGIITKIDAVNGTALVKTGDVVRPGTILIGGWMEGKYTGIRYVHSSGEVKAKVWHTARVRVDLKQNVREKTGKEETKYQISLNNFKINLYKKLSKFENYDTIETEKKIQIFSDFYIPVGITQSKHLEVVEKPIEYSKEQAKQMANESAIQEVEKQINNLQEVQDKTVTFYETQEYVEAEVTYEVLETIGTKEKIVF